MSVKEKLTRAMIILGVAICVCFVGFIIFRDHNPHIVVLGTWHGDGTWELLGDSPFDGAVELNFKFDRTGYVITEKGKTTFTYSMKDNGLDYTDSIILYPDGEHQIGSHGAKFSVEGKTLSFTTADKTVSFTRK